MLLNIKQLELNYDYLIIKNNFFNYEMWPWASQASGMPQFSAWDLVVSEVTPSSALRTRYSRLLLFRSNLPDSHRGLQLPFSASSGPPPTTHITITREKIWSTGSLTLTQHFFKVSFGLINLSRIVQGEISLTSIPNYYNVLNDRKSLPRNRES